MADQRRSLEAEGVHEAEDEILAQRSVVGLVALAEARQIDRDRPDAVGRERMQIAAKDVGGGAERAAMQQDRRYAAAFLEVADVEAIHLDEAIVGPYRDVHDAVPSVRSPASLIGRDAAVSRLIARRCAARHELEPANAVGDVGFLIGDPFGLAAGCRPYDDHAGAEAIAGIVEKGPGADQHTFGLELMDIGVMALGELLLAEREAGRRVDKLVIDHPALLACPFLCSLFAHASAPLIPPGDGRTIGRVRRPPRPEICDRAEIAIDATPGAGASHARWLSDQIWEAKV